jgi:hypothetical protein
MFYNNLYESEGVELILKFKTSVTLNQPITNSTIYGTNKQIFRKTTFVYA